ncbi:MAG: chitobiase/beta-hexosaminidase C-terminal domain-containing protein, partial [Rhodospirillales bacterium]|nr:chitobiase/beta-hexosaminidase C-terminal domain-containing protein [Acetobacter sp.]
MQASVIPVFLSVGGTQPSTAPPTFTPGAGSYTAVQKVTIADTAPGATIYYTTNGATPTTSSSQYSGPITVSSNETLKAVAIAPGGTVSSVASATYTLISPTASPMALSFGSQGSGTVATRTLTISNPGANALHGLSFSLFGADAGDFGFTPSGCDT